MSDSTAHGQPGGRGGFTLIELLVVISIISLLISILMPSLGRAREQAKSVHCLARLKDFGSGIAVYENVYEGALPPARWLPDSDDLALTPDQPVDPERPVEYGWTEILFAYLYSEPVKLPVSYPVQRNIEGRRWEKYFLCQSVGHDDVSSGHYRVYLPAWSGGPVTPPPNNGLPSDRGTQTLSWNPGRSGRRETIRMKLPLIGDANENSERGDGLGNDDCSYITGGEANYAGSDGRTNGNRFSDRHHGGTNYLFPDLHGAWSTGLREDLARDFDLNGVIDIDEEREQR